MNNKSEKIVSVNDYRKTGIVENSRCPAKDREYGSYPVTPAKYEVAGTEKIRQWFMLGSISMCHLLFPNSQRLFQLEQSYAKRYYRRGLVEWNHVYSLMFIAANKDYVDFDALCSVPGNKKVILSEEFQWLFGDYVNWDYISQNMKLSPKEIERYADKLNWSLISRYQTLNCRLMERYADRLDWVTVSAIQNIPEKFARAHAHQICWEAAVLSQKYSQKFLREMARVCSKNA